MSCIEENIKKLFFSKYPYKLVLNFGYGNLSKKSNIKKWIKKYKQCKVSNSHMPKIKLYFLNESDAIETKQQYNDYVTEYHRPQSENHLKHLIDGLSMAKKQKTIILDKLYYNTYRYRFDCKIRNDKDINEIYEWLTEYSKSVDWHSGKDWDFTISNKSLYFKDEQYLFVVQVALSHKIRYLEKVLLKSEIGE